MERGSKRKAAVAASPDTRPSKRQKTPDNARSTTKQGSADTTTVTGLEFIEHLKKATDKNGRLIAIAFLTLPDPDELPDYYEHILLPIAIDTVEGKLRARKYASLSLLEGDIKRMVSNAKQYNEPGSEIFQDAERVRKMTFNFMSKTNPAYKDPKYQATATPLPEATPRGPVLRLNAPSQSTSAKTRTRNTASVPERESSKAPSPASAGGTPSKEHHTATGFENLTFQQAQEKIIKDAVEYEDPASQLQIFAPFATLPTKKLVDYYALIQEPTSFTTVKNKIRGWHGREGVTGVTDFKTWDSFENEVAKIWKNAREYNEDGSDMYNLAGEFEQWFKKHLAGAKKQVDEPAQPTIKLNMAPKPPPIKLRLGSQKASPGPQSSQSPALPQPTNGVSVDQAALQRQRASVQAAVGGNPVAPARPGQALVSNATAVSPTLQQQGVKVEQRPGSSGSAPVVEAVPAPAHLPNGSPAPTAAAPLQPHVPTFHAPRTGVDSKFRLDDRDPLLASVSVSTHPDLQLGQSIATVVNAHPILSHQSVTMTLPAAHNTLQLRPELPEALQGPSGRPHKLFALANGMRISPRTELPMVNGEVGKSRPTGQVFDVKLMPGVNRLEIQCVASAKNPSNGRTADLELDRFEIFAHLLRW